MPSSFNAEFVDGFDKYGPAGNATAVALMESNEWTGINDTTGGVFFIDTPLSPLGQSLAFASGHPSGGSVIGELFKTLGASYARHIGGRWVKSPVNNFSVQFVCAWRDAGTPQLVLTIEPTGQLGIREGYVNSGTSSTLGTLLATSTAVLSANSIHVVEWDVTINATTGAYSVWLDGAPAGLSASGINTRYGTGNNSFNQEVIGAWASGFNQQLHWDNLYSYYYLAAGAPDQPLLDTPVVETEFPSADSLADFTPEAGVLGQVYSTTGNTSAPGANTLFLRSFTPAVNCTLNSVSCIPQATSAGANFKAVVYSDLAGAPNTLLSDGPQVTGTLANNIFTGTLTTPQALTTGTPYWVGFITDSSVVLTEVDTGTTGQKASNTYGSGAPGTAPVMTTGQPDWELWGNLTGMAHNYSQVDVNPAIGLLSYNQDNTVGDTDLYQFPNISVSAKTIHTVAIKVYAEKSDVGSRIIDVVMDSGGTLGSGSNPNIAPGGSFGWLPSYFDTDPHTSAAWTPSGVNAATAGIKIVS